jgi:D-alanyl-D-alanine endopeptidase (penicillin-binding protein 7)
MPMFKAAVGVVFSLCVVGLAGPVLAQGSSAAQAKKTVSKKSAAKPVSKRKLAAAEPKLKTGSKNKIKKTVVVKAAVLGSKNKSAAVSKRVSFKPDTPVVAPVFTAGDLAGLNATRDPLALQSNVALVMDQANAQILFEKNSGVPLPIASLTKLMTALVVVEANQNMDEILEVTNDDVDREKHSASRLRVGSRLSRANMLHIALMSSENRAASALGRNYPGGLPAFVAAMNAKAKKLGMTDAHYIEPTGLSSQNVASARDLAKLVMAAYQYPVIRDYSTDQKYEVDPGGRALQYVNSNRLVNSTHWDIGLQKTGYITEAGRCLVMQAKVEGRPVVMVFLDSKGKDSRIGDAARIRKWLEDNKARHITPASPLPPAGPQTISYTAAKQS